MQQTRLSHATAYPVVGTPSSRRQFSFLIAIQRLHHPHEETLHPGMELHRHWTSALNGKRSFMGSATYHTHSEHHPRRTDSKNSSLKKWGLLKRIPHGRLQLRTIEVISIYPHRTTGANKQRQKAHLESERMLFVINIGAEFGSELISTHLKDPHLMSNPHQLETCHWAETWFPTWDHWLCHSCWWMSTHSLPLPCCFWWLQERQRWLPLLLQPQSLRWPATRPPKKFSKQFVKGSNASGYVQRHFQKGYQPRNNGSSRMRQPYYIISIVWMQFND